MIVSRAVVSEIERALEASYPREGCGFLLGEVSEGVRVLGQLPAANHRAGDDAAATRYLITPEEFRAATRTAAAAGLEIVGVYHSHPDVGSSPSAYDRDHAWPWYHYLIVSVVSGTARDMRAWQLADDRTSFVERPIEVEETRRHLVGEQR